MDSKWRRDEDWPEPIENARGGVRTSVPYSLGLPTSYDNYWFQRSASVIFYRTSFINALFTKGAVAGRGLTSGEWTGGERSTSKRTDLIF